MRRKILIIIGLSCLLIISTISVFAADANLIIVPQNNATLIYVGIDIVIIPSNQVPDTRDQITALQTSMEGINALLLNIQKQIAEEKKAVTVNKPFDIMLFRMDNNIEETSNVTTEEYNIDLLNRVPKNGIVELKGVVNTVGYVTVTFPSGSSFIINAVSEPDSGNVEVIFH